MKCKMTILLIAVLVIAAGSVEGFDGNRKGFIIGGGVSLSPYGHMRVLGPQYTDTYQAIGHDFIIGWAFSDRVMLVTSSTYVYLSSDEPFETFMGTGYTGTKLYYYIGEPGEALLAMVGVGRTTFMTEYCNISAGGRGLTLGGGYEFARHFQATFSYTVGSATNARWDSDHTLLMLSITAVAY